MIVNCIYDEWDEICDIIYVPELRMDIEQIQEQFFKWMFDKRVEHNYWIIIEGEKLGCEYGTQAFVDWINNELIEETCENAYIIQENAIVWNKNDKTIYF